MAYTVTWTGASGTDYTYFVYQIPPELFARPGNYIFCKQSGDAWEPVYIGETGDLSSRFDDHHAKLCIEQYGATHIHAHLNEDGEQARLDEEADLLKNHRTPCNK